MRCLSPDRTPGVSMKVICFRMSASSTSTWNLKGLGRVVGELWDRHITQESDRAHIKDRICYISYIYIYIHIYIYNVKLGLITPAILINPLCPPQKKCNLKTGGPPGLINRLARTLLINPLCWNPILFVQNSLITFNSFCLSSCLIVILKVLFYCLTPFIFKWFAYAILKLKPHKHQKPSLLIIENLKKKKLFPKWPISN